MEQSKMYAKINKTFESSIEAVGERPDTLMSNDMNHFKVTLKNRKTGKSAIQYYSMGKGITDFSKENITVGLIHSMLQDYNMTEGSENIDFVMKILVEELGYTDKKQIRKVANAIIRENKQTERIGLKEWYVAMSEKTQEDWDDY